MRENARFTHVMTNFGCDVGEKRFSAHAAGDGWFFENVLVCTRLGRVLHDPVFFFAPGFPGPESRKGSSGCVCFRFCSEETFQAVQAGFENMFCTRKTFYPVPNEYP